MEVIMLKHYVRLAGFYFFSVCLLLVVFQAPARPSDQEEGFYSQIVRAVVRLEAHLSICSPGREWAIEKDVPVGSAFFIRDRLPGEGGQEISRYFVVTARHVVENQGDLFARMQAGPGSKETITLYLPRQLWVFDPTPTQESKFPVDVAVMMIPASPLMKAFLHCAKEDNPDGCGTNEKTNKPFENQIGEPPVLMNRAVFFGFPSGDVGENAVEPFARAGVVAYTEINPHLSIDGRPLLDTSIFLVDAPAFPGNSGGPIIRETLPLMGGIQLWGLMTGSAPGREYSIATSVKRIRETVVYARSTAKLNTDAWRPKPPTLRLKCVSDPKEAN
jgi:hypothetical protein